ncbi:hypothetical protein Tco_0601913 [Tanacetum coccineum]
MQEDNQKIKERLGFNFFYSTTGSIDSIKSILTQSALDALCEKFYIPDIVYPELPGRNDRIHILEYFQINLSQLSIIAAAKVSHFKILCCVYSFVPTIEMELFAFIYHADPTKVRTGEKEVRDGEVSLLELSRGRIVPLTGVNEQENQNEVVQDEGVNVVNEEGGDAPVADQTEQSDHVVQIEGIDIMAYDEAQAIVADQPKKVRKKRKAADGTSGSGLPPKKLKEDHGASGDVGASTAGKSLAALQGLLDSSTLAVEVGITAATTVPFVTSSVTPTPEREDGGHADSITGPNLRTQLAAERFVVLSDSSHHSSTNAADDEVTSVVPDPAIFTTAVATTIVADTFAPVHRTGPEPVPHSIFGDSASTGEANPDTASPSHPVGTEVSSDTFFIVRDMDAETLQQILQLSCEELSIKASSLESEKDKLIDQVSKLEGTCSVLRDEVSGYKLFKEQIEAVHDEQVKALSDHVAGLDYDLMEMALHTDEEFYPRYLTTIAGKRMGWRLVLIMGRLNEVSLTLPLTILPRKPTMYLPSTPSAPWIFPFLLNWSLTKMQRIRRDVTARRLSLSEAMVPLIEPLSPENLVGEANTLGVPVSVATTTALSTTFVETNSVPPIPQTEAPPSSSIVFEKEELDTTPEHPTAS